MSRPAFTSPRSSVRILATWVGTPDQAGRHASTEAEAQVRQNTRRLEDSANQVDHEHRQFVEAWEVEQQGDRLKRERAVLEDDRRALAYERDQLDRDRRLAEDERRVLEKEKEDLGGGEEGLLGGRQPNSAEDPSGLQNRIEELLREMAALEEQNGREVERSNRLQARVAELEAYVRELGLERRRLFQRYSSARGNMEVLVRVRPVLAGEAGKQTVALRKGADGRLELSAPAEKDPKAGGGGQQLRARENNLVPVDYFFPTTATNETVFAEIAMFIQSVVDGRNVCVAAYGQTGSGKTYMMSGLSRLAVEGLRRETAADPGGWEYTLEARHVEIYNQDVRDLLVSGNDSPAALTLHDDEKEKRLWIEGCTQEILDSAASLNRILEHATRRRATASTVMNQQSSRSHSVFTVLVEARRGEEVRRNQLDLVDLAGSEKSFHVGPDADARRAESIGINTSLNALVRVIEALGRGNAHVPYADSKLTRLLKYSLGFGTRALFVIALTPLAEQYSETAESLKFAAKVFGARGTYAHAARRTPHTGTYALAIYPIIHDVSRSSAPASRRKPRKMDTLYHNPWEGGTSEPSGQQVDIRPRKGSNREIPDAAGQPLGLGLTLHVAFAEGGSDSLPHTEEDKQNGRSYAACIQELPSALRRIALVTSRMAKRVEDKIHDGSAEGLSLDDLLLLDDDYCGDDDDDDDDDYRGKFRGLGVPVLNTLQAAQPATGHVDRRDTTKSPQSANTLDPQYRMGFFTTPAHQAVFGTTPSHSLAGDMIPRNRFSPYHRPGGTSAPGPFGRSRSSGAPLQSLQVSRKGQQCGSQGGRPSAYTAAGWDIDERLAPLTTGEDRSAHATDRVKDRIRAIVEDELEPPEQGHE
ncbi:hypothetical protein DL769_006384 [Monosporascus sp. CRB-8-3]|nr:hypothetical protein DL769_006384 [Monosporascus sp. CRB-8-3]